MKKAYGINVKILDIEERHACIPQMNEKNFQIIGEKKNILSHFQNNKSKNII